MGALILSVPVPHVPVATAALLGGSTVGGTWSDFALIGVAFAFGVGSGILPVVLNAELYVVTTGALARGPLLVALILSLAGGTVVGKAVVFELVCRGSTRVKGSVDRPPPRNRVTAVVRR